MQRARQVAPNEADIEHDAFINGAKAESGESFTICYRVGDHTSVSPQRDADLNMQNNM